MGIDIGKRNRMARKAFGWSLVDLENKSGITSAYLSLIENSKKTPSVNTLKKLSTSLNVPLNYFFTEIPECTECKEVLEYGHKMDKNKEFWYCKKCNLNFALKINSSELKILDI